MMPGAPAQGGPGRPLIVPKCENQMQMSCVNSMDGQGRRCVWIPFPKNECQEGGPNIMMPPISASGPTSMGTGASMGVPSMPMVPSSPSPVGADTVSPMGGMNSMGMNPMAAMAMMGEMDFPEPPDMGDFYKIPSFMYQPGVANTAISNVP